MKNHVYRHINHCVCFMVGWFTSYNAYNQHSIPIGITVNLDGKVQIATWEELQTENKLSDSVHFNDVGFDRPYDWSYLNVKKNAKDFEQEYLYLIDPPQPQLLIHSNSWQTISLIDLTSAIPLTPTLPFGDSIMNTIISEDSLSGLTDTIYYVLTNPVVEKPVQRYKNVVDYEGELGDTLQTYFTQLLREYALNNWEKHGLEIMKPIHTLLVERDTVIDEEVSFDYKIKKLLFYTYEGQNLTSVISFNSQYYGLEYDSLTYNKKNQLVSFHRNEIGDGGIELFLKYDRKGRVVETTVYHYLYNGHYDSECPDCKRKIVFETKKYFYGKNKLLNRIEVRSEESVDDYYRTIHFLKIKQKK